MLSVLYSLLVEFLGALGLVVSLTVWAVICAYFGCRGVGLAKLRYQDTEELRRRERPWNVAGFVALGIQVVLWACGLVVVV